MNHSFNEDKENMDSPLQKATKEDENTSCINRIKLSAPLIVKEEETDRCCLVAEVKKESEDLSEAAIMDNNITSTPMIKTELELNLYEIEYVPRDKFMYKQTVTPTPELIHGLEKLQVVKTNGEYCVGFSDIISGTSLCGSQVPVKTEPEGTGNEVVRQEWKLKNEEVDIKEEGLTRNATDVSSGGSNQENQRYNCQTKQNQHLKRHQFKYTDSEDDSFGCNKCEYRTIRKINLKNHVLKHHNPQKVGWFLCDKCEYRTCYRSDLKSHYLKHKSPEEVKLFGCDKCDYQTRYRTHFTKHCLKHKNPEQVELFRCDKCDYQTRYKSALKRHYLKHKTPEEVKLFRCDKCDFHTRYQSVIKNHCLTHTRKNPEEVQLFSCDRCKFQTIRKSNLKRHFLTHEEPQEVDLFGCDECEFRTRYRANLKNHYLRHKTSEEV